MSCDTDTLSVTVVIPCYNAQDTVVAAIDSVLFQKGIGFEIVCVNDGSEDATGVLLERLAQEGAISYLALETRQGASVARNRGLQVARGEFAQFLDADDTLLQGKLRRQIDLMRSTSAQLIAGAYEHINGHGRRSVHYADEDPWGGLLASTLGRTSANIFRTSALDGVGGWNAEQQSSQEYDLMFRLLRSGARVAVDKIVGARLNATEGSISQRDIGECAALHPAPPRNDGVLEGRWSAHRAPAGLLPQ